MKELLPVGMMVVVCVAVLAGVGYFARYVYRDFMDDFSQYSTADFPVDQQERFSAAMDGLPLESISRRWKGPALDVVFTDGFQGVDKNEYYGPQNSCGEEMMFFLSIRETTVNTW